MTVHATQPSGSQAVSLVVSRHSRHGASLESQRDKQAMLERKVPRQFRPGASLKGQRDQQAIL